MKYGSKSRKKVVPKLVKSEIQLKADAFRNRKNSSQVHVGTEDSKNLKGKTLNEDKKREQKEKEM